MGCFKFLWSPFLHPRPKMLDPDDQISSSPPGEDLFPISPAFAIPDLVTVNHGSISQGRVIRSEGPRPPNPYWIPWRKYKSTDNCFAVKCSRSRSKCAGSIFPKRWGVNRWKPTLYKGPKD